MNKNKLSKLSLGLAAGAIPAVTAFGGVFVITDDACPASKGDLEAHLNWESSFAANHAFAADSGIGFELAYGATETLEISGSLDFAYDYASANFGRKPEKRANDFNFTGISLGLKNQILDPEDAANAFGLAFVGGFSYAWANADETAARAATFALGLNFQKNFADGDLIFAFTPQVEFETAYDYAEKTYADGITYALAAGTSYKIADGLRVGVEGVYQISYSDVFDDAAFYVGPNFCFEADSWWLTAAVAPRVFSTAKDPDGNAGGGHEILFSAQLGFAF